MAVGLGQELPFHPSFVPSASSRPSCCSQRWRVGAQKFNFPGLNLGGFLKENPQFKEKRSIFSSREKVQSVGVSNFAVVT